MSVSGDVGASKDSFRKDAVRVLVPATSANLGPAFDSAGLALELVDELVGMVSDDPGILVEVSGEGSDDLPRDSSHLVVRAMALCFSALGVAPEGFVLRCTNVIPHGRGLGSSAAAIIGGLMLARALVAPKGLSRRAALKREGKTALQLLLGTLALFDFDRLFWLHQSLPRRRNWGLI
jgi:homoserine kinase